MYYISTGYLIKFSFNPLWSFIRFSNFPADYAMCQLHSVFDRPLPFFLLAIVHWLGLENTEQQQHEMPPALAVGLITEILPEIFILAQT